MELLISGGFVFVYVIVNDLNLKIYVGKTIKSDLQKYLRHKFTYSTRNRAQSSHLYAAIRKYGREHFHIYPLYEGTTNEEICAHERLLIKALDSQNPEIGYNLANGGDGGFIGPHSEDIKRRCREFGRISGRKAVESGQIFRISNLPQAKKAQRNNGRVQGRKNVESGQLAKVSTTESRIKGGHIAGRISGHKAVESGHWARVASSGACQRWNINRGKPCTCGKHSSSTKLATGSTISC